MKHLTILMFFIISVNTFGQSYEENDSLEIEPIDTTYTHPIGFVLGGGMMFSKLTPSNIVQTDTFSNWNTTPQSFFSIGILYNNDLNTVFSFQTGILFNISKISVSYKLNGYDITDITNYSTASIPFLFSWKPGKNPSGIMLSVGASADFDISKKSDKNNRIFPLKAVSPALYGILGYRIKTYASIIELRLFAKANPANILKNDNSIYSNAIDNINLWSAGLMVGIR